MDKPIRLKPHVLESLADFVEMFGSQHVCLCGNPGTIPPCSACTHEGNPAVMEHESAWEEEWMCAENARQVAEADGIAAKFSLRAHSRGYHQPYVGNYLRTWDIEGNKPCWRWRAGDNWGEWSPPFPTLEAAYVWRQLNDPKERDYSKSSEV